MMSLIFDLETFAALLASADGPQVDSELFSYLFELILLQANHLDHSSLPAALDRWT